MKGKIAFEEHMALPETVEDTRVFAGGSGKWDEFSRQILTPETSVSREWTGTASNSRYFR
jgi:hypothetical protein